MIVPIREWQRQQRRHTKFSERPAYRLNLRCIQRVRNVDGALADNKDPSYAATLMANSDERIFLYDNAAVVAGTYHAKGSYKGKPFDHYGRFTDTWVFMNGKWLCVASHTSPLKKER